jgi:hypothetical protein
MRSALAWSSFPCSTTRIAGCRSTSAATTQPDRPIGARRGAETVRAVSTVSARLAPTSADERGVSPPSRPVQQPYNTTGTNGRLPTPTAAPHGGPDSLVQQGEHR